MTSKTVKTVSKTSKTAQVPAQVPAQVETAKQAILQPEQTKAEIAYQKQLAALLAVGFSQADAEKALAAIKPVARQAKQELADDRWNLARGLSGWVLTPDSANNTDKLSPFIVSDVPADITIAQIQADVEYFLNNSTFANACKKGKQVHIGVHSLDKTDASKHAASLVAEAFKKLIASLNGGTN